MKTPHRLIVALFFGLSCISTVFAADMQSITVENPYARAVPPTARNSGAFMVIRNNSDQDRKVVDARSDVSEVTELHNHIHDNGVMRMRRVDFIDVPAHASVELKPGSYHVMLINLKQPLKPHDPVHIDLTLDDGSTVPVDLQARQVGMGMPAMQKKSGAMKCGSGM
jgi:copper(I)-binding protein